MDRAGFPAARLARSTDAMQGDVERGAVARVVTLAWPNGAIGRIDARATRFVYLPSDTFNGRGKPSASSCRSNRSDGQAPSAPAGSAIPS
ncbi:hypothetical protein SAMN04487926_112230 [Paraburkholderia steynii]|uniref:Uncharacterized protein n=1 Tax=Paraburkholderia steynii TaxID=1245441 RepID=A0A7Z7FK53_9BURK|nr:hypothetical protein [Paraburkholderia steynii]SDI14831.1 hypothetical protein SAMN04487926_112230 [Paraburkholderia steynii]